MKTEISRPPRAREPRHSSHLMLLFFALVAVGSVIQNAGAKQAGSGWNIGNKNESAPTVDEAALNLDQHQKSAGSLDQSNDVSVGGGGEIADSEDESNDAVESEDVASLNIAAEVIGASSENVSAPQQDAPQETSAPQSSTTENSGAEAAALPLVESEEDIARPQIRTTPTIDLDPQLRNSLEDLFKRVIELQETGDAFSLDLGEVYLSYGQALQRAGQLKEAREMFANALHISKINHGVNSMEQRPALQAMFEMSFAQEKLEDAEATLKRIIWLEMKYPEQSDDFSFDMILRLGNRYIDTFLYRPNSGTNSQATLDKATRYLKYAVDRWGGRPLDELLMPYGELALAHFLKSTIQVIEERPVFDTPRNRSFRALDFEKNLNAKQYTSNSFGRAERYLKQYLLKAKAEDSAEHTTKALIGLADINLLFNRVNAASQYYELAWLEAQKLQENDPIILSFDSPKALPSFNYTQERYQVEGYLQTVLVPMTFSVDQDGKVRRFSDVDQGGAYPDLVIRAKRAAKRMRFRPIIEKGKMIAANDHTHEVRLKVKRQNTDQG